MAERVNKLYKPHELVRAIGAVQVAGAVDENAARAIVAELHKLGFRVVHTGTVNT